MEEAKNIDKGICVEDKKTIVFIINPISGTSNKDKVLKMIDANLDKDKFEYDIQFTQHKGHAAEIARNASNRGVNIVCSVGGDGTVNETARALVHTDTALAIIPSGSGNGLARHLHIPINVNGAIGVLNECNIQSMDYGIINDYPFFCTCGMGFDAFISQKFAEAGKRGPLTYLENVLKTGLSYNPDTYNILIDDDKESRLNAFLISCANASQYGNNAYIAPGASVRDGLMDVTIIEPFTVVDAPSIAFQMLYGNLDHNSRIKTFRCKKLHVSRSNPGAIHYDGDPVKMGTEIDVQIVAGGLKCVSPLSEGVVGKQEMVRNILNEHLHHFQLLFSKSGSLVNNTVVKLGKLT